MNKYRKILCIIVCFLINCAMMTGCSAGSTINTSLLINDDYSGSRHMEVAIDSTVFQENFLGTVDDLNLVIEQNIQSNMTYSIVNDDNGTIYMFELGFTTIDDYRTKVNEILNREDVEIEVLISDSVWRDGITVNENFTSVELLAWLREAIVTAQLVDSSDASQIFKIGSNVVTYEEAQYSSNSSSIGIQEVSYTALDEIKINTSLVDGLYTRSIKFAIPQESFDSKQSEIEEFLKSSTPSNASLAWEEAEYVKYATIEQSGLTLDALELFNQTVFGSELCKISLKDTNEYTNDFNFVNEFHEEIDLTNYVNTSYDTAYITYFFDTTDDAVCGNESVLYYDDNTNEESACIVDQNASEIVVDYKIVDILPLDKIENTIKVKGFDQFKRDTVLSFNGMPSEEEQQKITDRLTAKIGESEIEFEVSEQDGNYIVEFKEEGTSSVLSENTYLLFDGTNTISYGEDKGTWDVITDEVYAEFIEYKNLTENLSEKFIFEYTSQLGLLHMIDKKPFELIAQETGIAVEDMQEVDSVEGQESDAVELGYDVKAGKVIYLTNEANAEITYKSSTLNIIAIILWLLLILGIVLIGYSLVKTGVIKECIILVKEKKALPKNDTPKNDAPKNDIYFCESCGSQIDQDTIFCESCGKKIER